MRIHNGIENIKGIVNSVLTIGTFDGVHIGHQKIINRLNEEASKINGESVLLTFYPHPRMVLNPNDTDLKLLQTQEEKIEKLSACGLQNLIVIPFTSEFAQLSAQDFVETYLIEKINIKKIIIGYDHQFGNNREGNINYLNKVAPLYNFEVIEIPAQEIDDVNISSTQIRNAILKGDLITANKYLGEPFQLNGKVVEGKQLGRTINFPTANIQIENPYKIIPAVGVYNVKISIENDTVYKGMLNIGYRPTVSNEKKLSIEVFILDFNKDIYGKNVRVSVYSSIRNEQKFESIDLLKKQLVNDEKSCRAFFDNYTLS